MFHLPSCEHAAGLGWMSTSYSLSQIVDSILRYPYGVREFAIALVAGVVLYRVWPR